MLTRNFIFGWILVLATYVLLAQSAVGQVIYVDANATGANNGSSWDDAYNYLQNGMANAESGDEIRVAKGVYKPDRDTLHPNGTGDRTATFQLKNGVALYGGFPPTGDPNLADRDPNKYKTILSGDLDGDDVEFVNNGENSYHVVTAESTNETAILDGFIITGGNAKGPLSYSGGGICNSQASPTLINCTFRVNAAYCCGGGMVNGQSSPKLIDCNFINNRADSGGAMENYNSSSPTLVGCKFIENWGGAILNLEYSSPMIMDCLFVGNSGGALRDTKSNTTVINCTFSNNSASSGGALYAYDSNSTLINCMFKGNSAGSLGGAVYNHTFHNRSCILNFVNCSFTGNLATTGGGAYYHSFDPNNEVNLINCTFAGNEAGDHGGGIYVSRIALEATNCVFWGNLDNDGTDESAQIHYYDSTPVVTFSCIQDDEPNDMYIPFGGTDSNNIDEYPMFVREPDDGGDGWGVGSNDDFGDVHLRCGSPCFNVGDNNSLPNDIHDLDGDGNTTEWIPFDLDGNFRIVDVNVDMGANEGPTQAFILDNIYVAVPEGEMTTFTVSLACEPNGIVDANVDFLAGDEDISVLYGATLRFDPNNFFEPNYVTLAAAEDSDFTDGTATIRVSAVGISDGYVRATEMDNDSPTNQPILYVDINATGENDGKSWYNAYSDLKLAINAANEPGSIVAEIRVAGGIYKPAPPGGSRADTFKLPDGVALYGGYAGCSGPDPNKRDIVIYETTLSGDLNGDDGPDFANTDENSYHVVTGIDCNETAVLDGFTITAGFANGSRVYNNHKGGGIYNGSGYPTVTNCIFKKNQASSQGGGMYNSRDRGLISGCTFSENSAGSGGGMYNNLYTSGPYNFSVDNCAFIRNTAYEGGGMFNSQRCFRFVLEGCEFIGNSANYGGGMNNNFSSVKLRNCTFIGNHTGTADRPYGAGAVMYNLYSASELINCTLFRNKGGGIYNSGGLANLINCILWHNSGREISLSVSNPSTVTVSFSNIQGGKDAVCTDSNCINWGEENIDVEPNLTPDGHLTADSNYCCINGGTLTGAPNTDRDGESRPYGAGVDIGSDEFIDTDVDRLPDWWEQYYFGSPTTADPNGDPDGDGIRNLEEYELYSSDPNAPPIPVNPLTGPFLTIQEAIDAASDGDTVTVPMGTYKGPGNRNLDFGGKSIILYAPSGAALTIIDCEGMGRGFYFHSGECSAATVVGFTIKNGQANSGGAIYCSFSSPQIKDCLITANTATSSGGGIYCHRSKPKLIDCTISGNTASSFGGGIFCGMYGSSFIRCTISGNNAEYGGGVSCVRGAVDSSRFIDFIDCILIDNNPDGVYISGFTARIMGDVWLVSNDWVGSNIILTGDGLLLIESDATLDLDDSIIRCNISGTGTVHVDLDSELIIEGNAIINLGHENDPNMNGQIKCDGLLRLRDDVNVANAQVYVTRASFEDNAIILNSVVTAEAGAPYGQFFIEDNVQIWLDKIVSDGDRYLDLDPTKFDCGNIHVGQIDVNITEGVGGTCGGLFELRGQDFNNPPCEPNQFACQLATVPDFSCSTWTINRLELVEGAKLNLSNRFDFQWPYDSEGDGEVLYVKQLILKPNSILNTAFNKLYYESLEGDPNQIISIPLLGFSLNNISFDDENDYLTRVKHNNFIDPDPTPPDRSRIHIERVVGEAPDSNGTMRMCNLTDMDTGHVVKARAKGLFAKSSENEIFIRFEYLFGTSDPNVELVVYLTDIPELLDHNDPLRSAHYKEVAHLTQPFLGGPGSAGSGQFGLFDKVVSKGDLDFTKGTRIEFELVGPEGTCILINNWDPGIRCLMYCGDVAGAYHQVNAVDFLAAITECGVSISTVSGSGLWLWCLDGFFCADGFVTIEDAVAIDWIELKKKNLCPCDILAGESGSSGDSCCSSADTFDAEKPLASKTCGAAGFEGAFLVAGKQYEHNENDIDDFLSDRLYGFNEDCNLVGGPWVMNNSRLNHRLIRDDKGELYQINLDRGLVRFSDGNSIVPVGSCDVNEPRYGPLATVYVGLQSLPDNKWSLPILDAAFDSQGNVYVVPVTVVPSYNPDFAYMAAAKLALEPNGFLPCPYRVVRIFDDPNAADLNDYERGLLNNLREIEVDDDGNVYVINVNSRNYNDVLWVYEANGAMKERLVLGDPNKSIYIPAPTGMHVSSATDKLYLSSSLNEPNADSVSLYVFSTDKINNLVRVIDVNGMGHITDITEDPTTGTAWVVGFTMPKIPSKSEIEDPGNLLNKKPFYEPYVAAVPYSSEKPAKVEAVRLSNYNYSDPNCDPNLDLALPLSIVWTGTRIDFTDFAILAEHWHDPNCIYPDFCHGADLNDSNTVDMADLAILTRHWLEAGWSPP